MDARFLLSGLLARSLIGGAVYMVGTGGSLEPTHF